MCKMTVYESEDARLKDPEDTGRFDISWRKLDSVGIRVGRVMCSSIGDVDPDGEAAEAVSEHGLSALPIAEYDGVVISIGMYPSDQDLADFLDVPDGTLSVDAMKPPSVGNDVVPVCNCGQRRF